MKKHAWIDYVELKDNNFNVGITFTGYTPEEEEDIKALVWNLTKKFSKCILNHLEGEIRTHDYE